MSFVTASQCGLSKASYTVETVEKYYKYLVLVKFSVSINSNNPFFPIKFYLYTIRPPVPSHKSRQMFSERDIG